LHEQLKPFYSDIGRPSVDPELMIRMLLVGYCYGIRHEHRLCQEVALHLAYRWFCKLLRTAENQFAENSVTIVG
jgi:transposase